MQEIYVAFKEGDYNKGLRNAIWIFDPNLIAGYLAQGVQVYRLNGLELVKEVIIEIKMEQPDASPQSS